MYFPDRGCVHTLLTLYVYATGTVSYQVHERTKNEQEEHTQQRPYKEWEEAGVATLGRHAWRWSVAQCVHMDAG